MPSGRARYFFGSILFGALPFFLLYECKFKAYYLKNFNFENIGAVVIKTDMDIRPIQHQKDQTIKAHIYTGIIAYQVVNLIRQKHKKQQIEDSWKTLLQKLNNYKIMNTQMKTRDNKTIFIKYYS